MTGLEKILKAIEADAQANAEVILNQAKSEAEEILMAANQEAEAQCKKIAEKSDTDVKDVISRAQSAAALLERKSLLNTKQQIINEIIDKARKRLDTLTEQEYTDVILAMVKKYAHNQMEGKLLFSEADRKRLTNDFPERLKSALVDKQGAVLAISDQKPSFEGGFLLVYGDIEENCSFDALFADKKDILQDKVNTMLFE